MQRLINGGCDPLLIARRLVVHSAEDVGLADPNALVVATNALLAFEKLGLPEGFSLVDASFKPSTILIAMPMVQLHAHPIALLMYIRLQKDERCAMVEV